MGSSKITGVVIGPDGKPIANAEVHVFALDGEGECSTTSDANGRFELSSPCDAEVDVWSAPPGFAAGRARVLPPAADVRIEVVHESALIGRVIERATGRPLPGVEVSVSRSRSLHSLGPEIATTDEDGRFRVGRLAPGRYQARIWADRAC